MKKKGEKYETIDVFIPLKYAPEVAKGVNIFKNIFERLLTFVIE